MFVCRTVAGFVYPSYLTVRLLKDHHERTDAENVQLMRRMLMYWGIMGVYAAVESIADFFVGSWYEYISLLPV